MRKHQIAELGLLREDEKNKLNRNYEIEIESLKIRLDQEESSFKKRLKELTEDYENQMVLFSKQSDERIKKLSEKLIDLEDELKMARNEIKRLKDLLEKEKKDCLNRIEEEKITLRKNFQTQLAVCLNFN